MLLERLAHDVRYAARSLRRSPAFALTATAVLAIGIGANTAIFSVAKDVLFRPLPYPEPDRLVQFISHTQTGTAALASLPKFVAWRENLRIYESLAAYHGGGPGVTLQQSERRERVAAMYASSSYFRVFDAPFATGRAFRGAEDLPQGPRVAVVSAALASRLFGHAESPVGQLLRLGDGSYEIVGVLDAGFRSQPHADVFLPLQAPRVSFDHTNYLTVVARLKPGVSVAHADRELGATTVPFHNMFPLTTGPYETFGAVPLDRMLAGDSRPAMQLLSAAVVFVLLIACANAANLFGARGARRRGDIATRAALGAGRLRLARQLFAECLLLAMAGGALGLAVGHVGIRALLAAIPGALAGTVTSAADSQVVAFGLALSVATAIASGLLPVLRASDVHLADALKDHAAEGVADRGGRRSQSCMVVVSLAMAIVLLVGAGLLARTFLARRTVDPGFRTSGVVTFDLPLNTPEFQSAAAVDRLVGDVARRLDLEPQSGRLAATYALPLEGTLALPFTLLDRPLHAAPYHGVASWRSISPGYFGVFGVTLLRGRGFTRHDTGTSERVVVISRSLARRYWQDTDPLGRRILVGRPGDREFDAEPRFVVGVVADVRDASGGGSVEPALYVPIAQTGERMTARNNRFYALTWAVRSDGMRIRQRVEDALGAASGGLPVARVRRIEDVVRAATAQLEFTTILLAAFAAAALALAAIGLYGLMSYSVEQRRQEIGIRLALGAEPWALRNMVLAEGVRLTAVGLGAGLGFGYLVARVMGTVVVGMATWDAGVFVSVAAILAIVSLAAAYVPAQDATRTDPLVALRRS
jgi:predicted permease